MDHAGKSGVENLRGGEPQIILTQLPQGLEEKLGQLQWEERIEDGAQCARLTQEQAEALMELVNAQGLAAEELIPEAGAADTWVLVWLPN